MVLSIIGFLCLWFVSAGFRFEVSSFLARSPEDQYQLGLKYLEVRDEWKDDTYNLKEQQQRHESYARGARLIRKAAEQEYVAAQSKLGVMYAYGQGVGQDETEAVKWFKKAAEQGDVNAQYNLGFMYANGRGVEQDEEEAVKWWRKAAEQEHADAQFELGCAYANGRWVEQDKAEAVKWYRRAAAQGHEDAIKFLESDDSEDSEAELIRKMMERRRQEAVEHTSLHNAAVYGLLETGKQLIRNGADVNATNNYGNTPLDLAENLNQIYFAGFLRKHGGKTSEELKVERDNKK
jgi:hypothetical protein